MSAPFTITPATRLVELETLRKLFAGDPIVLTAIDAEIQRVAPNHRPPRRKPTFVAFRQLQRSHRCWTN